MQGGMGETMLLQDELAQAFGFIGIGLAQLVGVEAVLGFALEIAAQGNPLIP